MEQLQVACYIVIGTTILALISLGVFIGWLIGRFL